MSKEDSNTYAPENTQAEKVKRIIRVATVGILIALGLLFVFGHTQGWFDSAEPLTNFIEQTGWIGFSLVSILAFINNIFPIIPGNLPGLALFMVFGPVYGFAWAVILICVGSLASFALSKRYGETFVKAFVPEDTYDKWIGKISSQKSATKVALIGYWVPGIYDGAVTMIVGLSEMNYKRFITILLLSKPIPTFVYFALATGLFDVVIQTITSIF